MVSIWREAGPIRAACPPVATTLVCVAHHFFHAVENSVHKIDVAVIETGLHGSDSIGADDFPWIFDIDAKKARRPRKSASAEIPMPGASTPPIYSPRAEMASKLIAVPKSTMMHGPPSLANAATLLTMRSAPTSCGLS